MPQPPKSFLLVPDGRLTGRENIVSVTSEGGALVGPVAADSGNYGRLIPIQQGVAASTARDIDYKLTEGGGTGRAEWIWLGSGDGAAAWKGTNDPRYLWGHHAPLPSPSSTPYDYSNVIAYASAFRRLVYLQRDGIVLHIRYRDVDSRADEWSSATAVLERGTAGNLTSEASLGLVELDDGSLLLLVRTGEVSATVPVATYTYDIDLYRSLDGGLTWRLVSERVLQRCGINIGDSAFYANGCLGFARSGEWLRATLVDSSGTLRTIVSSDRGASWKELSDFEVASYTGAALASRGQFPHALVGLNDGAGTFLLTYARDTPTGARINTRRGNADADWTIQVTTSSFDLDAPLMAIGGCRAGGYVYLLIFVSDGAGSPDLDQWVLHRAPVDRVFDFVSTAGAWERVDILSGFRGVRFHPIRLSLTSIGASTIAATWALCDAEASFAPPSAPEAVVAYLGGWTERSIGEQGAGEALLDEPLYTVEWVSWTGVPAGGQASADTEWTKIDSGTGVSSWTPDRVELAGAAPADELYYSHSASVPSEGGWAHQDGGSTFEFTFSLDTGDSVTSSDNVAIRLISNESATDPSDQIDVSIRMAPTGIVFRDNKGLNSYTGFSGLTLDNGELFYHRLFVRLYDDGAGIKADLHLLNEDTGVWRLSAGLTCATALAASPKNEVRFGHLGQTQASAMTSYWRSARVAAGKSLNLGSGSGAAGFTNPTNLFGTVASPVPTYLERGIEVSWVGAGGAKGDLFYGEVEHSYPIEATFLDSPRIMWRSGGSSPLATQTIIFDADPTNGLKRFQHEWLALLGVESSRVLVDYDTSSAFASPTSLTTLTGNLWTFRVETVDGAHVTVAGTTLPQRGEAAGMRARMTTGTALSTCFEITANETGNRLHFDNETVDLATQGVAVGDSLLVYTTTIVARLSSAATKRFMRVRMTEPDTARGYHSLGALVAGTTIPFSVPLDWKHTENEQPNVTRYRTRSQIGWAVEEAPPQRTWIGRVIGDTTRDRELFRDLMRQACRYEVRPSVLVVDDERPTRTAIYGKPSTGAQFDNVGWKFGTDGVWRTVGDLSLTFVEEV
jgi:hypothetical protein